jgi:hypothetical protein
VFDVLVFTDDAMVDVVGNTVMDVAVVVLVIVGEKVGTTGVVVSTKVPLVQSSAFISYLNSSTLKDLLKTATLSSHPWNVSPEFAVPSVKFTGAKL